VADQTRICSAALQEHQCGHDHGLAGPGLAGDDGETRVEGSAASSMTPSLRSPISSSTALHSPATPAGDG
jgi:hypothetical protein